MSPAALALNGAIVGGLVLAVLAVPVAAWAGREAARRRARRRPVQRGGGDWAGGGLDEALRQIAEGGR